MQVVGVGDDHRIGPGLVEHLPVIGEAGYPAFCGKRLGLWARVCHGTQLGLRQPAQMLVMLAAHDAGTNQGDA